MGAMMVWRSSCAVGSGVSGLVGFESKPRSMDINSLVCERPE